MSIRLAIVASHPIQYQGHWFREMATRSELSVRVFYGHKATAQNQAESGFGVAFDWDAEMLGGYEHEFLGNVSTDPSPNRFSGIDTPRIASILAGGRFDAVMVSGWHTRSYLQTIRACRKVGIPVMVRSDSHLHDARPFWLRAAKQLPYRWLVGQMSACLAVGTWSREYFLHYGASPNRVFIVPHSTNECVDADPSGRRAAARGRWRIASEATVFLLCGKLIERKRPQDFVRAIARVAANRNVLGLIVGDGPLRAETAKLVQELDAPIRFTGFLNQSELPDAYAAADCLTLPSTQDTWGLVVNEAMAWGLPCIVSDLVGCGPDLIQPGLTGYISRAGDPASLAAEMERMALERDHTREMGAKARKLISGHSPRVATDALIAALQVVCP